MIRTIACLLSMLAPQVYAQGQAVSAPGAVLRGLDTVSGDTVDLTLSAGESADFGSLNITLRDCRYPLGNPASEAFANLRIVSTLDNAAVFDGWMIASAPALSALDHPRFDLWVIRCATS